MVGEDMNLEISELIGKIMQIAERDNVVEVKEEYKTIKICFDIRSESRGKFDQYFIKNLGMYELEEREDEK